MAKRIRPLRLGRGVRLTFEVSADVDPKSDARPSKSVRKRPPAKSTVKRARPIVRRRAQPVAKDAPVPVSSSVDPTGGVPIAVAASGPEMSAPAVTTPPIIAPAVAAPTLIAPPTMGPAVTGPPTIGPEMGAPTVPGPGGVHQTARLQWAVLVAVAAVVVVAAVAFPRGPAAPDAPASEGSASTGSPTGGFARAPQAIGPGSVAAPRVSAAPAAVAASVSPQPASELPKKSSVTAAAKRAPAAAKSPAPIMAAPVEQPKKEEPVAVAASVEPAPASASESTAVVTTGLVTITGCLEISTDGDTFRLTDAEGADVPKARSWRSGFFKKRPAPVMVVDPAEHLGLKASVGKRVAATGQLANRDLRISSLRVVGPSCR